jgi:hypothetical protein
MRACRLVHWLLAQPDGGTAMLAELMPHRDEERYRWRVVQKVLSCHAEIARFVQQAADVTQGSGR